MGIEVGTSMVVKAAAGIGGVGAGAATYQATMDARARGDNETPADRTVAQAAQAAPAAPEKPTAPRGS